MLCCRGPFGLTREILKSEGILGLYKGLTSTFMREMPGYFFFFGGYEISRHLLTPAGKKKDEIGEYFSVVIFFPFNSLYIFAIHVSNTLPLSKKLTFFRRTKNCGLWWHRRCVPLGCYISSRCLQVPYTSTVSSWN